MCEHETEYAIEDDPIIITTTKKKWWKVNMLLTASFECHFIWKTRRGVKIQYIIWLHIDIVIKLAGRSEIADEIWREGEKK